MSTLTMPQIRVREKNQVTLPREVVEFFHIQAPASIEYKILPDGVLITPIKKSVPNDKLARLMKLSKPNRGVFQNAEAVDQYINNSRAE